MHASVAAFQKIQGLLSGFTISSYFTRNSRKKSENFSFVRGLEPISGKVQNTLKVETKHSTVFN